MRLVRRLAAVPTERVAVATALPVVGDVGVRTMRMVAGGFSTAGSAFPAGAGLMVRRWPPAQAGHLEPTAPGLSAPAEPTDWQECVWCAEAFPWEGQLPILCGRCSDVWIEAT